MNRNYKKIIKKIAKKHGVSTREVELEIQAAIDSAYKSPTLYAKCIPRQGETPTPEEVMSYVSNRVIINNPDKK